MKMKFIPLKEWVFQELTIGGKGGGTNSMCGVVWTSYPHKATEVFLWAGALLCMTKVTN
jgi:hypothetical protein